MALKTSIASDRPWLIVGHGSVGSFLARRIAGAGHPVRVHDPSPRTEVAIGERVMSLQGWELPAAVVFSCVPPAAATAVPELVRPVVDWSTVMFDWNTVGPRVKLQLQLLASSPVVDVALLDSLDADTGAPCLAISGPQAQTYSLLLEELGFQVAVAGDECGDAATLKLLRSVFMKSLEAMVIEFAILADRWDPQGIVTDSVRNSLGEQFGRFMDLLIVTNRIHAKRRAAELAEVVDFFRSDGTPLDLTAAAVPFMDQLAAVWDAPDAPPPNTTRDALVAFLAERLARPA